MTKTRPAWQIELERLAQKNGGCLNPEHVVQSAKPVNSPLHSKFTWDNTEAAHQYRLYQARQLIRVVVTVIPNTDVSECVWVSLKNDRGEKGYRQLVNVLNDDDMRTQLLLEAKEEMILFRKKYGRLQELSKVFEALRAVE